MTYLEELFEKWPFASRHPVSSAENIYLAAKLYDTFTLPTIRPLLDIISSCPTTVAIKTIVTKTDKNEDIYLTHIANCHDGIVAMQVAKLTAESEGGHKCIVLPTTTIQISSTPFCEHRV